MILAPALVLGTKGFTTFPEFPELVVAVDLLVLTGTDDGTGVADGAGTADATGEVF